MNIQGANKLLYDMVCMSSDLTASWPWQINRWQAAQTLVEQLREDLLSKKLQVAVWFWLI